MQCHTLSSLTSGTGSSQQCYQPHPPQAISPLTQMLLERFQRQRRETKMRGNKMLQKSQRDQSFATSSPQIASMRCSTANLMPTVNHGPSALALAGSASALSLLLSSREDLFSWKYWESSDMVFVCVYACFIPAGFAKTKY